MFFFDKLYMNILIGIAKNSKSELKNTTNENGIKVFHIGNWDISGWIGAKMAIAINAFASAPPNISPIWNKKKNSPTINGMNRI